MVRPSGQAPDGAAEGREHHPLQRRHGKESAEMNNRKLKKSLDYANKEGIKYVIIIGSNELETGNIIIKDMINGNNIETRINEIANLRLK